MTSMMNTGRYSTDIGRDKYDEHYKTQLGIRHDKYDKH